MKAFKNLVVLLSVATIASPALAADGHKHGVAALEVSMTGDTLSVALEVPLDSLLGFERVPKYDKDLAKVREVAAQLRQGEAMFAPSAAASCKLLSVKLASAVLAPELLGEATTNKSALAAEEHADLDAEYQFKCAKPAELKGLEVRLFDSFKRIRLINAALVTEKRQSATKLTPKGRTLSW